MSSIPLIGRFIRKTPHSSVPQHPPPPDRANSTPSFYAPADSTRTSSAQRPTVNIPTNSFPYITTVPWPPQNPNKPPKPTSNTQPTQLQASITPAVVPTVPSFLPVQEPVTHSNAFRAPVVDPQHSVVLTHPESLIPARPSVNASAAPAVVPHLIDIPIDSGPAFDDDMFRRKSDPDSSKNSSDPKTSNQRGMFDQQFSVSDKEDKSSDQQVITIPIGRHPSRGQRPSSPSIYSESSSTYSYVSAPELEYGYDDPYRLSSPRSHRLTRKDSTTLPQELVWHLLHGGGPRNREDDDDRRSRHSSVGKRSVKSRRNSDGGASIHTARRSTKSNSKADIYGDSVRSHSRSRSTKSKHPRMSGTSLSSSLVSSTSSPTPSTLVHGHRAGAFPSPREPMPVHALKAVQAAQAILVKESVNPTPNAQSQFWDKSTSQRGGNKHQSSSRNTGIDNLRNSSILPVMSASEKMQARASFIEYLDSPSDEVTLPAVLTGYNNQRGSLTHAYANMSQPSNPPPLRKDAPLPPMPDSPHFPTKTRSRDDFYESNATSQNQRSSPPVLPFPITHDKSRSDSLYPELSDKYRIERTKSSHSRPSTSTSTSTSVRPPPSPSRPLPARPADVPDVLPMAGPSKPNKTSRTSSSRSPRPSTADQKSRKTVQSDQTIKPISIQTSNGMVSSRDAPTYFKDAVPTSSSSSPPPLLPPPLPPKQDRSSPRSESFIEQKPVEEKTIQGDSENGRPFKSSSDATLQVLTTTTTTTTTTAATATATATATTATNSPSTVQQPQQLTPDMASAPSTSPSSYSSHPGSSSNVTSVCSVEVSATRQDDIVKQREGLGHTTTSQQEEIQAAVRNVSLSSSNETEKQTCGYGYGRRDSRKLDGGVDDFSFLNEEKVEEEELSSKDRGDIRVKEEEVKGSSKESPEVTIEACIGINSCSVIPEVDVLKSHVDKKEDVQRADEPVDEFPEKVEEDKQQPEKENCLLLSENMHCSSSTSNSKDQDLNASGNGLRKSIHDSSIVSIPWNSSTGSVGSQRLKNGHYMNPSFSTSSFALEDAKPAGRKQAVFNAHHAQQGLYQDGHVEGQNDMSLRPEQYPLPRSMSSVELPLPSEDQKGINDSSRVIDGRTSSPNAYRTRPFSPHESIRSFSSHNVEHKPNRSMGDVSQAASGLSEVVKMSSPSNQQRPPSRNSSTFMTNGVVTRNNRSSTLPTVEGVSPTPVSSHKASKATLPIGNKSAPLVNEPAQVTRTRSGSEPHPSVFHHRSGRLSTIQQSPIQHNRPSALPLRHERLMGSMTFPETPYEYTPMTTPGPKAVSSPHARGPSSTSNRQRKTSRLGSDVSLRRPAGPRPPRNNSSNINNSNSNNNNNNNNNNNSNNNAKNASSKFASPPNTARSFDLDPASDGGVLPDFRPRPVEWRANTMEAALWTFTSEQLQEIVGRAIRQSAVPSTVRLLTLNALDEIKPEIERLEILQQDVSIRYCANITRRRGILKSLKHHLMDADWTKRSQLVQELNDTSYLADQLTRDLFHTMYRLQQLYRLMDVHNGSALAMALRKLNSSFVKQLDDMTQLTECLAQSEAEKEEAWATAERFEREAAELRDKLETMSMVMVNQEGTSSENSSRRDSARKPSVRASKASFRLSRARFSHTSSNSSNTHYPFSPPPPVPPIPRHAHGAPNSRILSLNTDISSSGILSIQSAQSFGFSPTPEALALEREVYDLLGLSRRPRKSLTSRPRPVSEILSPVTTDGPLVMSSHKHADHLLRRNNSIPISPYIISENFRH